MALPDNSKNDFAELVMAGLRESGMSGEISCGPEEFDNTERQS
jgi:hypothetical protein